MRVLQTKALMKIFQMLLVLSFFLSIQHKFFDGPFALSSITKNTNHHKNEITSLSDMTEILFTGSIIHTHDHEERDGDSHSHSHQHQSGSSSSISDFLFFQISLFFPALDQHWQLQAQSLMLSAFYFEILRPPILHS